MSFLYVSLKFKWRTFFNINWRIGYLGAGHPTSLFSGKPSSSVSRFCLDCISAAAPTKHLVH